VGISKGVGSQESLGKDVNNGHAARTGRRSNGVNGVGENSSWAGDSKFCFE
jgi:hypothetical protein